jgi:hypothetical protein
MRVSGGVTPTLSDFGTSFAAKINPFFPGDEFPR